MSHPQVRLVATLVCASSLAAALAWLLARPGSDLRPDRRAHPFDFDEPPTTTSQAPSATRAGGTK